MNCLSRYWQSAVGPCSGKKNSQSRQMTNRFSSHELAGEFQPDGKPLIKEFSKADHTNCLAYSCVINWTPVTEADC